MYIYKGILDISSWLILYTDVGGTGWGAMLVLIETGGYTRAEENSISQLLVVYFQLEPTTRIQYCSTIALADRDRRTDTRREGRSSLN